MQTKTLNSLVNVTQKYLEYEHPELEYEDAELGAKMVLLYMQLTREIEDLDATIIRHNVQTLLDDELDLVMEIEKIGLHSGFVLHIEQDPTLIASWSEERFQVD